MNYFILVASQNMKNERTYERNSKRVYRYAVKIRQNFDTLVKKARKVIVWVMNILESLLKAPTKY